MTRTSRHRASISINAPGERRRFAGYRGFTLVEILVVVLIMAIVVSMTVLSIGLGGRDTQLDQETRRIAGLLDMLHERAVLEGRDFGMRIEPAAYEFVVYEPLKDRWLSLSEEGEFRRRELPKGLNFQLQLDGQTVVLKAVDRSLPSDQPPPRPQLAVAASGEGTPFRLSLQRPAAHTEAAVDGDAFGKISREGSDKPARRP